MHYSYHNRIKQRIDNNELSHWQYVDSYNGISPCLLLYFEKEPKIRPIREHRFEMYEEIFKSLKQSKPNNMNREIKFRAWDYQHNKWANKHGEVEDSIGLEFGINDWFINIAGERALRWSFVQYTGIKDSYGTNIYENDIIKCLNQIGKVIFRHGCYFVSWYKDGKIDYESYLHQCIGSEIIGNIYEYPHLLK